MPSVNSVDIYSIWWYTHPCPLGADLMPSVDPLRADPPEAEILTPTYIVFDGMVEKQTKLFSDWKSVLRKLWAGMCGCVLTVVSTVSTNTPQCRQTRYHTQYTIALQYRPSPPTPTQCMLGDTVNKRAVSKVISNSSYWNAILFNYADAKCLIT